MYNATVGKRSLYLNDKHTRLSDDEGTMSQKHEQSYNVNCTALFTETGKNLPRRVVMKAIIKALEWLRSASSLKALKLKLFSYLNQQMVNIQQLLFFSRTKKTFNYSFITSRLRLRVGFRKFFPNNIRLVQLLRTFIKGNSKRIIGLGFHETQGEQEERDLLSLFVNFSLSLSLSFHLNHIEK